MKILLIDDEQGILDTIPDIAPEHEWLTSLDSKQALSILESTKIDMVIVDFLPNLDALNIAQTCEELSIPVILYTGKHHLAKLPFNAVVLKPETDTLKEVIDIYNLILNPKKAA